MQVLFVEDDALNRRVVGDMLATVGIEMDQASSAEIGLTMVEHGNYDAVLMDLCMPGMDGLTAIKQMRCRFDTRTRVPIIVITAVSDDRIRNKCLEAGADRVLCKPIMMSVLFEAVGRAYAEKAGVML